MNSLLNTVSGNDTPDATAAHPSGATAKEPLPAIEGVMALMEKIKDGDEAALDQCTLMLVQISQAWSMRNAEYHQVKADRDNLRATCESLIERIEKMSERRNADLPPPGRWTTSDVADIKPRGMVKRLFAGVGF